MLLFCKKTTALVGLASTLTLVQTCPNIYVYHGSNIIDIIGSVALTFTVVFTDGVCMCLFQLFQSCDNLWLSNVILVRHVQLTNMICYVYVCNSL